MRIVSAGFHALTAEQYHADPAPRPSLSSGCAATLVTGQPKEAWWGHPRLNPDFEEEDDKKFDLGTVAHALILGKGRDIVAIDADHWRKADAKAARKAAIEDGKQPCLLRVYEQAEAMRTALLDQLADDAENHDAFDPAAGESEVCAFWQESTPFIPIWCRSMMDRRMIGRPTIYDYKTFDGERGADPEGFIKNIVGQGKDVQPPHYSAGLAAVLDIPVDEVRFCFIVQCPKPPYLVSVVELTPYHREWSHDRWIYARDRFASCLSADHWPGYPARTHHVNPPGWAEKQWEERLLSEEMLQRVQERELA